MEGPKYDGSFLPLPARVTAGAIFDWWFLTGQIEKFLVRGRI